MAYSISRTPLITQRLPHLCILLIAAVMSACVELPSSEDDGATVAEDPASQQLAALVAYAGDDVNVEEDAIVTLSGSSEGGEAPTYSWRQLSGAVITLDDAHSANISFAAPNVSADTTLTFELEVSDGGMNTANDEINVTILAANDSPDVEAGPDQAVIEGALVTLDGTAQDEDSQALSYQWTQVSGPTMTLDSVDSPTLEFQIPVTSEFKLGTPAYYATDNRSISVEMADVNGDETLDLAVANFRANTISVLLGKGDGTFHDAAGYAVGSNPYSVKAGDLNHDEYLDLVAANAGSDEVTVLINNGNGTFAAGVNYAVGAGPWYADIGDLNGDNHPDLVTGNEWDDNASVLLGNGDGTFAPATHYHAGDRSLVSIMHDYNHDGFMDLAVTNQEGPNVSLLFGNGDGSFSAPAAYYTVGLAPRSLQKGDFNGDDEVDLVIANEDSHTVSVLLSNGDGTFHNSVDYPVGENPRWAAVGDLNGDGKNDIAAANRLSDNISVLMGVGDGTFKPALYYDVRDNLGADLISPYGIAIGDLNGDGKSDIATADYRSYTTTVFLNESTFAAPATLVFRLTVTDEQGASRSDDVVVNVTHF